MLLKVLFQKKWGIDFVDENKIIQINELLKKGESLTKLEDDGFLGCTMKTFRKNAKKIGYEYSKNANQYVKTDVTNDVTSSVTNENSNINSNTNSVTTDVTTVTSRQSKGINIKSNKEIDSILKIHEERIKALEALVLQNNTNVTPNTDAFTIELKKDIITRSIKVSKSVINDFNNLAETKFCMYNKQDLLSKALAEFVEKYK